VVDKIVRVVTANLLNGGAAIGSLRRMLEREEPDVGVFQELAPAQARIVRRYFAHGTLDPRRDYHGMGIAAHHPIEVERFEMVHRDGWKGLLHSADWPQLDRDLEVINVHIQNPLMRPWRETSQNRKGQVSAILEYVAAKRMARVVLGDMNSSPAWRSYKRLATQLQDAAVAAGTARRTWAPSPRMPRLLRIDHAFVEGVVPVSTHTARIKGSDHSAVVVDLLVE
jgi:endonuclease/exonuclease/phosphatase (EEP) superfamily protein YafD